ncbi:hypothetical protein AALP_AA8G422200 [Arabis alpina]|uniref:Uncharacterized protein n=1 Tax=Arabis alpina TaxID=50452 RepID=A0A087GCY1_ARAAL|nr:hypothetical protein AALP_AA8G422200 [Arabis alpina]
MILESRTGQALLESSSKRRMRLRLWKGWRFFDKGLIGEESEMMN